MINEEKVILMTKMSVQAKELEEGGARINQYYRGDYVGFQIVKSAIAATILFCVLLAAYAAFNFNALLDDFYKGAGMDEISGYILLYFVLLAIYVIVSYVVYSIRYTKSRKQAREYYNNLKRLEKYYHR